MLREIKYILNRTKMLLMLCKYLWEEQHPKHKFSLSVYAFGIKKSHQAACSKPVLFNDTLSALFTSSSLQIYKIPLMKGCKSLFKLYQLRPFISRPFISLHFISRPFISRGCVLYFSSAAIKASLKLTQAF